ncbi:MAG: hypothetical protein HOE93_03035 [Nitrosopumilus sp.]|nr:hypothetical protein [Nitrosopumilus sp.]MBT3861873.1 hypothetical protein [Nitrosopumilus sp.]MBT3956272.1 hypothetical protein [Nitrosopumilus sp.]MBT4299464.1 hypothetical protein [Nitrosopumilus sp.]MBT4535710.1 hypothetical protein [Nitrosopumilus sp.]
MMIQNEETEEATKEVIDLLEEWGSQSKFIWFRELHRITDIDKGLLRNILNELKKSKEVKEMHGTNNRIFFCLKRYYIKCRDVEFRFKGKVIMLKDGSKTKIVQGSTSGTERTRKRLLKQQTKRKVKQLAKNKHQHNSRNR